MIVVVSKDRDFSHTLAEQVVRELEMPCECLESFEDIKLSAASPDLIITTEKSAKQKEIPQLIVEAPIHVRNILADIASRLKKTGDNEITIGKDYIFSPRKKLLSHSSGRDVTLTDKEAQLLAAIIAAGSAGIAKEELLKAVWGIEADLNTHTLETHIYRLRNKCKELAGSDMIEAEDGRYRL